MRFLMLMPALGGLIVTVQAQDVVRGEYWLDVDPGWMQGTSFTIAADNDTAGYGLPLDLDGYQAGTHTLGLRTVDDEGRWSLTNFTPIVITRTPESANVVRTEYFLNTDPGFAAGGTAWAGSTVDLATTPFTPDLTDAVAGVNTLLVRTHDADGKWGLTNHLPVTVIPVPEQGMIDRVETFALSTQDPGFGAADPHAFSLPAEQLADSLFNAPVPVQYLLGDTLMIRTHDSRGIWSLTGHVQTDFSTTVAQLENRTKIAIGPNPFSRSFSVDPHGTPVRVFIYDPQGRLVYDHILSGTTAVDLGDNSAGAYTAFFWQEQAMVHRLTLVKQ